MREEPQSFKESGGPLIQGITLDGVDGGETYWTGMLMGGKKRKDGF